MTLVDRRLTGQNYIVYGRPSFGARLELASLLAANGGDGSAGYALSGFPSDSSALAPGLATSTTTVSPTCGSRHPPLTPTGSRTTARFTSSTASPPRP